MRSFKFYLFFILVFFVSCSRCNKNIYDVVPEYKLIKNFSEKVEQKNGLLLCAFGVNNYLPKDYKYINGVARFNVSYKLTKKQQDQVSVEEARALVLGLIDDFLREINSSQSVRSHLDVYPFTGELLVISIYFIDENQIELGQGVASVYLREGQLGYERYDIEEYTGKFPAVGKHYTILKETIDEARNKIKAENA